MFTVTYLEVDIDNRDIHIKMYTYQYLAVNIDRSIFTVSYLEMHIDRG